MADDIPGVVITRLPMQEPPLPPTGGRIVTPAGELAQIINGEPMQLVTYIEFQPAGKPRGNHFHKQKTEFIYVIKGALQLTYEDLASHTKQMVQLTAGDLVRVQPNFAHVYVAQEYTQAIEMTNVPYDPSDTIPYMVEES